MSRTDENKPTGKPGQRNRKAERNRKPDSAQKPKPEQRQDVKEQIHASDVPAAAPPISAVAPPDASPIAAVTTAVNAPIAASPSADAASVNLQTIAQAYGDYTKKSLEEMRSFVEKLTGVRSPNKAIELQTEFVKQAYATFVAESQKICELHSELAKQSFKPLERMVAKATRTTR
jgi:phasin family protein